VIRSYRPPPDIVPDWLVNIAALGWRILVTVALGVVLLQVALLLSTVTAAIVISVIAAAVFAPFVAGLRARGWSNLRAAGLVTAGVVAGSIGLVIIAIITFVPYVPQLIDRFQAGLAALTDALAQAGLPEGPNEMIDRLSAQIASALTSVVASIAASIANAASIAILALFTTFFLLLDGTRAWNWTIGFLPPEKRPALTAAGRQALVRVGRYFRGAAVVATIDAVVALVALLILGIPLAGPMAILVFLLGFIPYFGTLIATAALALLTWAAGGLTQAAVIVAIVIAVKVLQARYLDPVISGRNASIHPALVLVVLPIGAMFGGFAGIFIVIPVVAMLVAVNSAVLAALDPGPAEERGGIVPGWLDRLSQWSWRLLVAFAVAALVIAVIASVPILFLPGLFAVFFAATLAPAFTMLVARGQPRTVAALVTTGGTFAVIGLVIGLSLAALVRDGNAIAGAASSGANAIVAGTGLEGLADLPGTYSGAIVGILTGVVTGLVGLGIGVLLFVLLSFFFLRDGGQIWSWILERLPARPRSEIGRAGSEATSILSGYMIGTAAISAFGAATQFAIMFLLGLPLALPLAALSFFGGFIPYIGSLITTGIAFLVTVQVGSTTDIVVMLVFTLVFNIVQGNFVAPLVYGKAVNLHPAIVLLSIPAGAALAGVTGMILVVPLLGVVATTWRTILAAFADEPPSIPPRIPSSEVLVDEPLAGRRPEPGPEEPEAPFEGAPAT
jgi:predicted PurR-regulated permease PerM